MSNIIFTKKNYNKSTLFLQICGKTFSQKSRVKRHMNEAHDKREKVNMCTICGKGFALLYQLKRHTDRHEGIKNYHCQECGLAFTSQQNVNRHVNTVHEGRKDHKCEYCGEMRTTSHSLKKHILQVHHGINLTKNKVPKYPPTSLAI